MSATAARRLIVSALALWIAWFSLGGSSAWGVDAASRRLALQATAVPPALPPGPSTPVPVRPRYVVLIVFDGARPEYFKVPGIPHTAAIIAHGTSYKNAFTGILESETPAGHAAIASGSEPRDDGILGFTWVDGARQRVTIFDPALIQAGLLERLMSHGPTLAGLVHQQDTAIKVVALGGYKYYANDALGGPSADVIMYYQVRKDGSYGPTAVPGHVPPKALLSRPDLTVKSFNQPLGVVDHLAMKSAIDSFTLLHQQVTLINLPEFDMPLGHVDGATRDPKDAAILMHAFDRDLGAMEKAYRAAGVLDQTLFVFAADHGFVPIDRQVQYTAIRSAVMSAGTTVIHGNYHSGAYLWIADPTKARKAARAVAALKSPGIQSVYYKKPDRSYARITSLTLLKAPGLEAANQYLLQTFAGPNGPDVVVLFKEGTVGVQPGELSWKGDHGGADWESQHVPLILSGPGVRSRQVSLYPARLMDIAPTILELLGVPHDPMRGSVLADALVAPTVAARTGQDAQRAALAAVVASLKTEARLELKSR